MLKDDLMVGSKDNSKAAMMAVSWVVYSAVMMVNTKVA